MTTPELWIMPVPFIDASGGQAIITSWYGDGRGHVAIDVGATDGIDWGTPILAPIGGRVVATGYDGPFRPPNGHTAGRWLWFIGDDGSFHKFFHTAEGATVPLNQHVDQGEQIARVGNTGTIAAHLHWEVHRDAGWASPTNFDSNVRYLIDHDRWAGHVDNTPTPTYTTPTEDEMTPDQEAAIFAKLDYLDRRLEQVAAADRATMAAVADQRAAVVIDAIVRADADNATEADVTRKRDELLAVVLPHLADIDADLAELQRTQAEELAQLTQEQAA